MSHAQQFYENKLYHMTQMPYLSPTTRRYANSHEQ